MAVEFVALVIDPVLATPCQVDVEFQLPPGARAVSVPAAFTVIVWAADVSVPLAAVIVKEPAAVSLYLKSALLALLAIVMLVIVTVSALLRKRPVPEVLLRLTVMPPPRVVALPAAS
jgi:hypothetical protein